MSKSRRLRPVVLLRGALLAALALFLGGVVAVFLSNRMNLEADGEAEEGSSLDLDLAKTLYTGKGFDYEVTEGDRRLYHVRADRILASRDNVVSLEGLVLTIERPSGSVYELRAKTGDYRTDDGTAVVEGDVLLAGPDGVELRGPKFALLRKGKLIRSRGPVEFAAGGNMTGSADEIEAFLHKDQFVLSGTVRLLGQGAAPEDDLALSAERVLYDKPDKLIHAEGGIRLRRGRDRLTCDRIAVTLADDEGKGAGASGVRFVRARWNVSGSMVSSDPRGFDRQVVFTGEEVAIAYGRAGEPRRAEITGTVENDARLDAGDETGLVRRFTSRRLEARFVAGKAKDVRTGGPMTMTEFLAFDPGRELGRVCGDSGTGTFDADGSLVRFVVSGNADLHRPGLQTSGDKLTLVAGKEVGVVGKPAHVYTRRGELSAPVLSYLTETGDLRARDGVRAWLPPEGGFSMVKATDASDDLPIQVTSKTATWTQSESRFQFDGDVRAWQGESFLTAGSLIGENDGRIRGRGGIQTTLERSADVTEEEDQEPPSPVKVTATSFEYSKTDGLIEYTGAPEVRDSGRLMSCNELSVHLQEGSSLDRLECRGQTLIDDRVGGHTIRGSEALYQPDDSKVEVSGSPVILKRPDGAIVKGSRVIYDFETSVAQFKSAGSRPEPTPSEGGSQ